MRKALVAAAALAALFVPVVGAQAADTAVGLANCAVNGGHVTRPAGSTVVARFAFSTKSYGLGVAFLHDQTTAISVGDRAQVDVSDAYAQPVEQPDGSWTTSLSYPTGVTLAAPGDSMTFRVTLSFAHLFADVQPEGGRPLFGGPGVALDETCTVTAA